MDNRSLLRALAIAALVLTGAAVIAVTAYNAGTAHGIAESARAVAPPAGALYPPYAYAWRPWGFGYFPVFPLFFLFLFLFFVVRGLLWRGAWRGGRGCGYYGGRGVPPAFDEWHRRAHGEQTPPQPPTTA